MAMDQSVICLSFSLNSELLVSGSTDGKIAIWRVQNGFCQRKYTPAHSQGVTSVRFNKDASEILSCSYDHTVKIHSVKSGKLIREFKGHRAFVNSAIYFADYTRVISASSDGEVKVCITLICYYYMTYIYIYLDLGYKQRFQHLLLSSRQSYNSCAVNHIRGFGSFGHGQQEQSITHTK